LKKTFLPLAGLALLVALQAAAAWSGRLLWKGKAAAPDEKVRLLRRAEAVFPWDAAAPFELGKACFERGVEALGDPAARDRSLGLAAEAFLRSLRLDPGVAAVHFHLAQTLLYMSYVPLPTPLPYFEEYRLAARLTGHNSQIFFDVGKVMLGRWPSLAPDEKEFAVDVLRRSLAGGDEERLLDFLETWRLEVGDYGLVRRILPESAGALRAYARFLGERALSLEERQAALARAEGLGFLAAQGEVEAGRREAEAFRLPEAAARFRAAIAGLGRIRFYQTLAGRQTIDPEEYEKLRRTARRLLAMNRIEATRSLVDEDGAIAAYLAGGDEFTALGEFERFLEERGLIGERSTAQSAFRDLPTLVFRMNLDFLMNRYRDIVRVGDLLASSSVVVAPSGRPSYVRILGLIGEADLKLDYVYEAERHFRMALEVEPENLEALLGLQRCFGRLNDEARAAEVRARIEKLTGPGTIDLGGKALAKGERFALELLSDGRPETVRIELAPETAGATALAAVILNGRVAWENTGDAGFITIPADLKLGRNSVGIEAVGAALRLRSISRTPSTPPSPRRD
jgi:tetratricopeptide (TPR) repeat protein